MDCESSITQAETDYGASGDISVQREQRALPAQELSAGGLASETTLSLGGEPLHGTQTRPNVAQFSNAASNAGCDGANRRSVLSKGCRIDRIPASSADPFSSSSSSSSSLNSPLAPLGTSSEWGDVESNPFAPTKAHPPLSESQPCLICGRRVHSCCATCRNLDGAPVVLCAVPLNTGCLSCFETFHDRQVSEPPRIS